MTQHEFNRMVVDLLATIATNPPQGSNDKKEMWECIQGLKQSLPVDQDGDDE